MGENGGLKCYARVGMSDNAEKVYIVLASVTTRVT